MRLRRRAPRYPQGCWWNRPSVWSDLRMAGYLISRAALLTQGLTPEQIRRMCNAGELRRVRRGFYLRGRVPEAEAAHRLLVQATAACVQPGTVISHISAGVLHNLPVPRRSLSKVSMLRDGSGGGAITRRTHLRRAPLSQAEQTTFGAISVTTLPRTVVDLCRCLDFPDAVAVADVALQRGLSAQALLGVLDGTRQHGNAKARAAIVLADPRSESPGESRCRATMHLAGLPQPELQFHVSNARGDFVARVDFAWPQLRVVGEYDGEVKYRRPLKPGESADDVIMREKAREERIRRCGYWVTRWVAADLRDVEAFRASVLRAFELAPRVR